MTNLHDDVRLRAAIAALPDPGGLGARLPHIPRHPPVKCMCKCGKEVGAVLETPEGALFIGRVISEISKFMQVKGRRASHNPSWTPAYALLIEGRWHGSLAAYCQKHGTVVVDPVKLANAWPTGRRPPRTIELRF